MDIGQTGDGNTGDMLSAGALRALRQRCDASVRDYDANIARPAAGREGVIEEKLASHRQRSGPPLIGRSFGVSTISHVAG
ncbi:MAG: hypothetical protein ACJ8EA_22455 [Xanthobacteraceae bacterium]